MNGKARNKRRFTGFSLVEMVVSISLVTVLMVLNVGWMHYTMRYSSAVKQRRQHHQCLHQLSRELRDDVRRSEMMELKSKEQLVLSWPDGTQVEYSIAEAEVFVKKSRGGVVVGQNRFSLASNSSVRWDSGEMPEWISLIVTRGLEGISQAETDAEKSKRKSGLRSGSAEVSTTGDSMSGDSMPIDLHVRVAQGRWLDR